MFKRTAANMKLLNSITPEEVQKHVDQLMELKGVWGDTYASLEVACGMEEAKTDVWYHTYTPKQKREAAAQKLAIRIIQKRGLI
jgi:hypothetical protein